MTRDFNDDNKSEESSGKVCRLNNEGDWISGIYLGYSTWTNDQGNTVCAHNFADPESNTCKFEPGEIAVVNGVSRSDRWLAARRQGSCVKIRFDGKVKPEGFKYAVKDFTFWEISDLFNPNWRDLSPDAAELMFGKLNSDRLPDNDEGPAPKRSEGSSGSRSFSDDDRSSDLSDASPDVKEIAKAFDVDPNEPPFLTDAEKLERIMLAAKDVFGALPDDKLREMIMDRTRKALIPGFYDDILKDLSGKK